MARNKVRRSRQYWRELVDGWADSGLTQQEYCELEGVALSSWQRWRRIFGKERQEPSPVSVSNPLVAVKLIDIPALETDRLTLTLPSGERLEIPPGFDGATLQSLLGILRSGS